VSFLSVEAPDFNPGEHAFRRARKSASTRRASAPALHPVAQPFLAVLRRSPSLLPGNPITEQLVSGHGFSRAVSLAKSIPPLGAEGFCGIGFSLCVFPVGGSPGFQSRGARLQACAKKRKHAKGFSPGPSPSVTAISGCAPKWFCVRARLQPCRKSREINPAFRR